ncbi:MAG: alpha-galactosidase [Clostridia bacterium]|nr:alpha-galactosidase [Clostridia bacterium]
MLKRILCILCALSIIISVGSVFSLPAAAAEKYINNSDVLPKWVDVRDPSITVDEFGSPSWLKDLVLVHAAVNKKSTDGTLMGMLPIIDHYVETGINGIWLSPLGKHNNNPYLNWGWHTIDSDYTGTEDFDESLEVLADFVDECHKRNMRVFLDFTSWGLSPDSDLLQTHPEFFTGQTNGQGKVIDWANPDLIEFYVSTVVKICTTANIDGVRYDVEPRYSGYGPAEMIKSRLYAMGRKMAFVSELGNDRVGSYDFEQWGVNPPGFSTTSPFRGFIEKYNIVDAIKTGSILGTDTDVANGEGGGNHYYSIQLTCHDSYNYAVRGNRVMMGYHALFTPFIPMWEIGEEFNNPFTVPGYTLFTNPTDFSYKDINREFYEDVKKLFRIRWQYKEIFANNTESTIKDANICKVIVDGGEEVQSYARYADNKAIVVVPNMNSNKATKFTVYTPFTDTNLQGYESYKITDLLSDKVILKGSASKVAKFSVNIPYEYQGIYLIEGIGKQSAVSENKETEPEEITEYVYITSEDDKKEGTPEENDVIEEPTEEKEEIIKKPVSKSEPEGNNNVLWIIIAASVAAVVAAGAITLILVKRKSK